MTVDEWLGEVDYEWKYWSPEGDANDDLLEWAELRFRAGDNASTPSREVDQWIDVLVEDRLG